MCLAECIVIIASCVKLTNILSDNAESSNCNECPSALYWPIQVTKDSHYCKLFQNNGASFRFHVHVEPSLDLCSYLLLMLFGKYKCHTSYLRTSRTTDHMI